MADLTDEQKQAVSDVKERAQIIDRLVEPRIAGIVPGKIFEGADEIIEGMDPITGMIVKLPRWQFEERWAERRADEAAQEEAKRQRILAEQRAEALKQEVEERLGKIEDIPAEQKYIRGANATNRVWGRNNIVAVVIERHATKLDLGNGQYLIVPPNMRELTKEYSQLWERAVFVEPVAVSDWIDDDLYPGLAKIRDDLKAGKRAPTLEICPGAGTPRLGANGEACVFVNAQHVWMEFWNDEEKLGPDQPVVQKEGSQKGFLSLLGKIAGWRFGSHQESNGV